MSEYISYQAIPRQWGLRKGDVLLLSSDILDLATICRKNKDKFDPNLFLDKILEELGPEGTLLLPTYNWDFCHGKTFDYYKTPCKTGALGITALKRPDFRRTRHPIYSFAVAGKDQALLCAMDNVESFGEDSPFPYLQRVHAKNVMVGVDYSHCFTYVHYFEQKVGVEYRFNKTFTAGYIDENGEESVRDYSMYVRKLDIDLQHTTNILGEVLEQNGVARDLVFNGIHCKVIDLAASAPYITDDIVNNKSRGVCKYIGQ